MSEMSFARLSLGEAVGRIRSETDTLILFHRHPDGDAVGSAFALRCILEALGCRVLCASEDEIPARLRFLIGDMQESTLQENLPADFVPAQILAVDTASPSQMGKLYELYVSKVDLMLDHHGKGEMYADGWILPECSSTGEMILAVAEELMRTGRLSAIPAEAARLMYAAISSDTGCFRFSNASPSAHRAAAKLLEHGFDAADINHRLFAVKSADLLRAEKLAYDRLRLFCDGRVAIVDMPMEVKRAHGLSDEHLETMVEIPRSLAGVEVAVAIRQPTDDMVYRVSMRASVNHVDVSEVAALWGGGGHKKAAGCTIVDRAGVESVIQTVAEALSHALGST